MSFLGVGLEGGKLELNDGSLGRKSHLVVGKTIFPILWVSKDKDFACLDLLRHSKNPYSLTIIM